MELFDCNHYRYYNRGCYNNYHQDTPASDPRPTHDQSDKNYRNCRGATGRYFVGYNQQAKEATGLIRPSGHYHLPFKKAP